MARSLLAPRRTGPVPEAEQKASRNYRPGPHLNRRGSAPAPWQAGEGERWNQLRSSFCSSCVVTPVVVRIETSARLSSCPRSQWVLPLLGSLLGAVLLGVGSSLGSPASPVAIRVMSQDLRIIEILS